MKIVIFNIKYSPNLGDGVVAECLESELSRRLRGARIESLDLAGRTHWGLPNDGRRRLMQLGMLQRMPHWLRDLTVEMVLRLRLRTRCLPVWRRELSSADVAVFGGGQLIQDGDLNFPIKLSAAAAECKCRGIPLALFAVGAAPSRSARGARLLSSLLHAPSLAFASARDDSSARDLRARGLTHIAVTPDPGLLATRVWPLPRPPRRLRPVVGLGITHPAVLRHHGGAAGGQTDQAAVELYGRLVSGLVAAGYDVTCFSNGAHEDEALLMAAYEGFRRLDPTGLHVRIAPRCARPQALAALIASFDAVIAHRLHACVLAYSYRVPHIGLVWDSKLQSFFASVARAAYAIPLSASTVTAIPPLLAQALAEGIDAAGHASVLNNADVSIDQLAAALIGSALRRSIETSSKHSSLVLRDSRTEAWT